jgi:acetyltransferase-like isoleucine patch superfamily enzyme
MIKAGRSWIGKHVEIDPSAQVQASELVIGDYVKVGPNFRARVADRLELGECTIIGQDVSFAGRKVILASYVYMREHVAIGGGQATNERSIVSIGRGGLICEDVLINDADTVTIGDDVGIGKEVDIWTHAGFLSTLDGYPSKIGPVTIGNHVWVPSRTSILPDVEVGDNVIIGNHSLVNRDVPSGCFAAGVPAKIIKKNCYPMTLTPAQKLEVVESIVKSYRKVMKWKGFSERIVVRDGKVEFGDRVVFDFLDMTVDGRLDKHAEDFRDHLRRNGIKFYTGKPFLSINPPAFVRSA